MEGDIEDVIDLIRSAQGERFHALKNKEEYVDLYQNSVDENFNTKNISTYLREAGLRVFDKRSKGGRLWVVGDDKLKPLLDQVSNVYNVTWVYCPNGGKTTSNKPSWFAKLNK